MPSYPTRKQFKALDISQNPSDPIERSTGERRVHAFHREVRDGGTEPIRSNTARNPPHPILSNTKPILCSTKPILSDIQPTPFNTIHFDASGERHVHALHREVRDDDGHDSEHLALSHPIQ